MYIVHNKGQTVKIKNVTRNKYHIKLYVFNKMNILKFK